MFRDIKSNFGQPSPAPTFGSGFNSGGTGTSSPFGQSAFGKPATTGFTTPAFGSTGSSLFGSPAPATGGLFGGTSATPVFGQPQSTQPSAFGGFTSTAPSGSLFGAQQTSNTGLFGTNTTSSAFGANKPAFGGFGTTQTSGGLFGQQQQQPQAAPSLFGQTATQSNAGIFGTGGFGGGSSTAAAVGTVVKFTPVTGTDTMVKNGTTQTISTRHHCITCMKEYENKSLEELRLEDYVANRKGPQQGAQQSGGLFGASTQPSLFGASTSTGTTGGLFTDNKSMFGATTTLGGFGGQGTSVFGQTSQPSGGLFGKPPGFGATTTTAPTSGFSFNSATTSNPFGQTAQVKPFGVAAPQANTMFGAATSQPSTGFGTQSTGFGGFGAAQPNQSIGLFGQNKTPFNQMAATSSGFTFGQNTATNTGGLFGAKPAGTTGFGTTGFGATATPGFGSGGTMFGTNQNTSLFSQPFKPATTSFSFGQTAPAGGTGLGAGLNLGGGSMFGSTAAKPNGGLFGTSTGMFNSGFGGTSTFGATNTFGAPLNLGGSTMLGGGVGGAMTQQGSAPSHQQILALASMPFGDSPLFRNLLPATGKADELLNPTSPAAQKALLSSSQFKVSPRGSVKLKVKPLGVSALSKKSVFDGLEEDDMSVLDTFKPRMSSKRLMLKVKPATPEERTPTLPPPTPSTSTAAPTAGTDSKNEDSWLKVVPSRSKSLEEAATPSFSSKSNALVLMDSTVSDLRPQNPSSEEDKENINTSSISNFDESSRTEEADEPAPILEGQPSHPTGVVLRRVGYYTIPSLDELTALMRDDGSCVVDNFTVGREGYGNVFFPDSFDVAELNLDEIVHFRHKEIVLYPDDDKKPPVGSGLNRRAQVTLDRVWPIDKTTRLPITDVERLGQMDYEAKLCRVCAKLKTRFVEYRPQTGSWVFKVDHFSKYGLSDSDDDEPVTTEVKKMKLGTLAKPAGQPITKPLITNGQVMNIGKGGFGALYQEEDEDMQDLNDDRSSLQDEVGAYQGDIELADNMHQSPTTLLSQEMVSSSHKVQLMKASFFMDDEDRDVEAVDANFLEIAGYRSFQMPPVDFEEYDEVTLSKENGKVGPTLTKSFSVFRTHFPSTYKLDSLSRTQISSKHDRDSVSAKLELPPTPSLPRSRPLIVKPEEEVLKCEGIEVVPWQDSILHRSMILMTTTVNNSLYDAAAFKGRSYRARWSVDSSLLSLTTSKSASRVPLRADLAELGSFVCGRSRGDRSQDILQRIRIKGGDGDSQFFRETVEPHLSVQLDRCVAGLEDDCPALGPSSGVGALHAHCTLAQRLSTRHPRDPLVRYAGQVWELAVALWGDLAELEDCSDTHQTTMVRRAAVSDWLEKVVLPTAEEEMASLKEEDHVATMLSQLSAFQMEDACNEAQKHGDHFAAFLLSQLSSSSAVGRTVQLQLDTWRRVEADQYIEPERLKLLMLVAGLPLLETSHGTINVCENLDWKRAFAMHLWYLRSPVSSVTDALLQYQRAFEPSEGYAAPPVPPYMDNVPLGSSSGRPVYDLCYHLLGLDSTKTYPLDKLLNPATHCADPLDHRLSWLVLQVVTALGYCHVSPLTEAQVHTSFAAQLESHGMWHWAIFVLLHLKDRSSRQAIVQETLGRHVQLSDDPDYQEQEEFLRTKLRIPAQWIFQAKATLSASKQQHKETAWYLIKAGQWSESHQVIMDHIAPNAIVNEKYDLLEQLLSQLEPSNRSGKIAGWANGGQLLWDYMRVVSEVEALTANRELATGYHLERLQPQLSSLCTRINLMPCPSALHRLAKSEISQRTAHYVRSIITLQRGEGGVSSRVLAHLVTQLALPEDCIHKELRRVTTSYISEGL